MDRYQIIDISKKFGKQEVLSNLNFSIEKNKVTCILGSNGSGKTTLIKSLLGLLCIDSGEIKYNNKNIESIPRDEYYTQVSAVLEGNRNTYWYMSGEENIRYFGLLKGMKERDIRVNGEKLLKTFSLYKDKDKKVSQYSRGMQQKLSIIISLLNTPSVLFLDEPTLGLDVQSKYTMMDIVGNISNNISVILTSHQLDVVNKLADDLLVIEKGKQVYFGDVNKFKNVFGRKEFEITMYDQKRKLEKLLNCKLERNGDLVKVWTNEENDVANIFNIIHVNSINILEIKKYDRDLEDIFLEERWKGNDQNF